MVANVPVNAMPLGTALGAPIPLDVARPKFARTLNLTLVPVDIVMPEDLNLVTFYCSGRFLLRTGEPGITTPDGWEPRAFYGEPSVFYDMVLPRKIRLEGAGELKINCLEKWAAVANEGQFINS